MMFHEQLRELRLAKNYTQRDLSIVLSVSEPTISAWERGIKSPSMTSLIDLATHFNVSLDYLVTGSSHHGQTIGFEEASLLKQYRKLDSFGKDAVKTICEIEYRRISSNDDQMHRLRHKKSDRFIPLFISPSAAGLSTPIEGSDFDIIPADDNVPRYADFAVRIHGDSMFPFIHDGEIVYVEKTEELENGDVGIFCVDGSMYCKQCYKNKNGVLHLLSANEERKDTNITLYPDGNSSVKSYGKVIMKKIRLPEYFEDVE